MWLLLLAACASEDERELRVASGGEPDWNDEGSDTAVDAGDPVEGCGGEDGWAEVEGALSIAYCARLTPECGSIDDASTDTAVAIPEDTGAPFGPAPPPCGFVNLVGDLGLVGTSSAPRVLYCDSDADGGVRLGARTA